jgi:hypothetical protein
MDDAEARAFVCKQYKQIPNDLRARMIAQVTAATPPATQTQPQTLSMKKIIAALVAAGFQTSDDADESNVLGHVTALVNERNRLQAENTKHLDARKARVTAIVSQAITDKLVAETRREALITLGQANEEELTAQIADLRTLSSTRQPRGAAPARRTGETGADAEAQVADLQDQMNSRDCTAEARGALAMESLKARGLDQLFKKNTAVSGHN